LDLKMPLENGRADERVSRGQASERAVCVYEAVSVEKGARRPPLPTAVVCPPGRRRRRRLAITAVSAAPWTHDKPRRPAMLGRAIQTIINRSSATSPARLCMRWLLVIECLSAFPCAATEDNECQYCDPNTYCFVDMHHQCPPHSSSTAGSDDASDYAGFYLTTLISVGWVEVEQRERESSVD
jgi:hypothetical protein